jgi:CRP/FNR family transcriptional regulator, cyclic AMP receptor protein
VLHAHSLSSPAPRPPVRRASLLDLDPDLGAGLSPQRLAAARITLAAHVVRVRRGAPLPAPGEAGLLILSGALSQEVVLEDTVSTELLGPGDVVLTTAPDERGLLELDVRRQVLADAQLVRLGAPVVAFPEIACALLGRVARQADRLATLKAISQLNSVERRLVALFRHLAERWGRVTVRGIVVPLTLSHRLLGELVGARRPTISVAIGVLAKAGTVERLDDGSWLLAVDAPPGRIDGIARPVPHRRRLIAAAAEPPDELGALRQENARLRELLARAMRERTGD